MSSLYGAGHANANVANVASAADAMKATTTSARTLNYSRDPKDIEAYVREEFADTPIMIDVARCESTFRQFNDNGMVVRGRENKQDIGVMQINEKYHAEVAEKLGIDIYTTEGNVAFGKYLYSKYGTKPWVHSSKCWSVELAKK